jgi:hypothetical protein
MPINDLTYFIAFCVFLIGTYLHFRGIKPKYSLWVMAAGVLIDYFATILPNTGFKSLAINIGTSVTIVLGATLGVLVWTLFLAAVFVRLMGRLTLFYVIIVAIKVMWFLNIVFYLYGVYHYTTITTIYLAPTP